jgi:hypothetical protein
MAHDHHPGHGATAHAVHAHGTAEDEYLATPPGSGHEHTDANIGIIAKFGFWLLVSALVVHVGMWLMFTLFVEQREEPLATQPYPTAVGQERRLPAGARLQAIPENEIYEFRQQEQQQLEGYGWTDRAAGRVRIPISEAMRLTVERGFPVRTSPPAAETPAGAGAATSPAAVPAATAPAADGPAATAPAAAAPRVQEPGLMPADSSSGRTMERRR